MPTVHYPSLLAPVIQDVLCKHMPKPVLAAYNDADSRKYLVHRTMYIYDGNREVMSLRDETSTLIWFYGCTQNRETIQINDAAVASYVKGSLAYDLSHAVIDSGYAQKHVEQRELLESVKKRLRATIDSVSTVKRLYDVLEPELHHLIPKESSPVINLPATAAPVVDDLRRLGAVLPENKE